MRTVYLILAIIGTILPMYYFVSWFEEFGYSASARWLRRGMSTTRPRALSMT